MAILTLPNRKPNLGRRARNGRQSANPSLWNGIVGLWSSTLGNTGNRIHDVSGRHNQGTNNGATWMPSEFGPVLDFDGSTQFVVIPDKPILRLTGSQGFSVVGLIKPITSVEDDRIIDKGGGTSARDGWTLQLGAASNLQLRINSVGGSIGSTNNSIIAGVWNHFVAMNDGTDSIFFINGVFDFSGSYPHTPGADTLAVTIGRKTEQDSNYYDGQIGLIQIYERILSADEIGESFLDHAALLRLATRRIAATVAAAGFVPYPNPLLDSMTGGMAV